MANRKFEQAEYDKVSSTYRQVIYFINGKTLDGYSKKIGFSEPVDPTNCLTNFILRMYIRGYLRPCAEIDPVDRIEYRYNKSHEKIVTCYYDFPDFNPEVISHNVGLVNWVSHFYEDTARLSLEEMITKYHRSGRQASSDELDINQHAYHTPDHLVRKVLRLIQDGNFALEHIAHFYRQCKEKYFPNLGGQTSEKYDAIVLKMLNR